MGCAVSRMDQEERVRLCKERKRLMRELVGYREEFANSQLSYLKALKNTGVTLRQFTDSDTLELETISCEDHIDSSPLPPPPPPPPPFSPDSRKNGDNWEESEEMESSQSGDIFDDSSSMMNWFNKDSSTDVAVEALKIRKTLEGIMQDLNDYLLKASAGATEIAVFTDINIGDSAVPLKIKENKGKRSRSSKALPVGRDSAQCGSNEPCKPGAHCVTLDKLYVAEQNHFKDLELERKLAGLQNQDENSLETYNGLQESITTISSSILEVIDEELYPQLIALTSGLMEIWKMMYKCHDLF
ncbi:unnamed protein product [Cuscuta epithymum]|uniref:Uncharacterized protein n=1 Tax=Cuscuta epithymum TaxID=186058 RepID=A0AAV0D593_9ASTE|nr:unnamed protein product [Cuscuta epithymum]